MNKKICSLMICLFSITLIGCGSNVKQTPQQDKAQTNKAVQIDPETYKYSQNARFKVIEVEKIDDGTTNGIVISTLVDKNTKVMYSQTEKFQAGYGISREPLIDKDGKPLLYDGDLK